MVIHSGQTTSGRDIKTLPGRPFTVEEEMDARKIRRQDDISAEFDVESKEMMNLNAGYLVCILKLMDDFTYVKVNGLQGNKDSQEFFIYVWELLDSMRILLAPKIIPRRPEEYKMIMKAMDMVYEQMGTIFVQTHDGLYVNKWEAMNLRRKIGNIYQQLLIEMEYLGMLTFMRSNPNLAMTKYTD